MAYNTRAAASILLREHMQTGVPASRVGIVLAGGRSTRMGTSKASLVWRGQSLLQWSVMRLQMRCSQVLVVAPQAPPMPAAVPWVHDEGEGPLVALAAALKATPGAQEWLVVPVDMLWLQVKHIDILLRTPGASVRARDHDGHGQPLPWLLRGTVAAHDVTSAVQHGRRALRDVRGVQGPHGNELHVHAEVPASALANANDQETWAKLVARDLFLPTQALL
jgi:molybdenum cofactor guanylyltransferase